MAISVITVTYNVEETLLDCLDSLKAQSSTPQHIVVDGGSTDTTLAILQNHGLKNMKMISESDGGIYDAMNKGLAMADNDVIGILNGDDIYANADVLQTVETLFDQSDVDACYGDLVYVDRYDHLKIMRNWRSGQYDRRKFYWGWMPPHPTVFIRRQVYEKHGGFNLNLGSAADYELLVRMMVRYSIRVSYIPDIIVRMRTGGASNAALKSRIFAHLMDHKAWLVNGLIPYPWTVFMKPIRKLPQWFVGKKVL